MEAEPAHTITVAAIARVAPMATAVAGVVLEDPAAVIAATSAEPGQVARCQQLGCRFADQPEDPLERHGWRVPRPAESFVLASDPPRGTRLPEPFIQRRKIVAIQLPSSQGGPENPMERFAQLQRSAKDPPGLARPLTGDLPEDEGLASWRNGSRVLCPGDQVKAVVQFFVANDRLSAPVGSARADRIDKVQAQTAPDQVDRSRRPFHQLRSAETISCHVQRCACNILSPLRTLRRSLTHPEM